jgi:hypothetical protein
MATVVTAALQSESVTDGDSSKSMEKTFILTAVDSAAPTVSIAFTATDALGALDAIGTVATIGGQSAKVTSRAVDAVADAGKKVWTGTVSYAWSVSDTNDFVSLDMNTSMSFVDVYRMGATFPQNASAPGDTDIQGTPMDACGEPVSAPLFQQELTLVNIKSTNQASNIIGAIGKRNSETFLGADAGYVLFTGASSRRVGVAKYEITYKFLWDGAKHLRQIAARDVDGQPLLTVSGSTATASAVYARQPFPSTSDFAGLSLSTS